MEDSLREPNVIYKQVTVYYCRREKKSPPPPQESRKTFVFLTKIPQHHPRTSGRNRAFMGQEIIPNGQDYALVMTKKPLGGEFFFCLQVYFVF